MEAAGLHLAMVAGEASSDLLGGLLLRGLRRRWPQLRAVGIGGPKMLEQGFESWWPQERLSVFGYVDALKRLPELLSIRRRLAERLLAQRPKVFVGVDAPDFNFGLEVRLRRAGLKTVHFVCPSIWAWRPERVHRLAAAADHVLCLFPFEPGLLADRGIPASFVGHPLADAIPIEPPREPARSALGLDRDAVVVALMPGSRTSEVDHIAPAMLEAAKRMMAERGQLEFVLPVAPGLRSRVEARIRECGAPARIRLLDGEAHAALAACDVALVASGTATLEAALFKRPMVIAYRVSRLNWLRMRRMNLQPWFGLPNILSGEFVVPELIQDAATPDALAREALAWLDDAARVERLRQRFVVLHHQLRQDTARRAGDAIAKLVEG